jgi:hypothetical protein
MITISHEAAYDFTSETIIGTDRSNETNPTGANGNDGDEI